MSVKACDWCLVVRPSAEDWASEPFADYVSALFAAHPGIPMVKVVPPAGWRPRAGEYPPLESVHIATPIRQHAFGTKGCFQAVLVEQKGMSARQLQQEALLAEGGAAAGSGGHSAHEESRQWAASSRSGRRPISSPAGLAPEPLAERAFWSSITIAPPLYGADTPQSFFDERLEGGGWNLRNLGCLLKSTPGVPSIPGVTTPMAYFGMWRSFFSWHVEDADLYSINYLHFGAPKVWYAVSPAHRKRFERMAATAFPALARDCPAFLRHKDILISPSLLRANSIPYVQAKQMPGEFIVLNAAAYHSGYNLGFNCAEAINFATPAWLPLGRSARPCRCQAMMDAVHIDVRKVFGYGFDTDSSDSEEAEGSEEQEEDGAIDSTGSDDDCDEELYGGAVGGRHQQVRSPHAKAAGRGGGTAAGGRAKGGGPSSSPSGQRPSGSGRPPPLTRQTSSITIGRRTYKSHPYSFVSPMRNRWLSRVHQKYLGSWPTIEMAARASDAYLISQLGWSPHDKRLNFPRAKGSQGAGPAAGSSGAEGEEGGSGGGYGRRGHVVAAALQLRWGRKQGRASSGRGAYHGDGADVKAALGLRWGMRGLRSSLALNPPAQVYNTTATAQQRGAASDRSNAALSALNSALTAMLRGKIGGGGGGGGAAAPGPLAQPYAYAANHAAAGSGSRPVIKEAKRPRLSATEAMLRHANAGTALVAKRSPVTVAAMHTAEPAGALGGGTQEPSRLGGWTQAPSAAQAAAAAANTGASVLGSWLCAVKAQIIPAFRPAPSAE